jgi:hypothetical protein
MNMKILSVLSSKIRMESADSTGRLILKLNRMKALGGRTLFGQIVMFCQIVNWLTG